MVLHKVSACNRMSDRAVRRIANSLFHRVSYGGTHSALTSIWGLVCGIKPKDKGKEKLGKD